MGRQILGEQRLVHAEVSSAQPRATQRLLGPRLQQRLRQKRSQAFVGEIGRMDAGTHQHDQNALDRLIEAISAEFPELVIDQRPLGIVAKCHLGHPFEVHICDLSGGIVQHFEVGHLMPPLFERARGLTRHGNYCFIEVYADTLRAVSEDGSVSVLER